MFVVACLEFQIIRFVISTFKPIFFIDFTPPPPRPLLTRIVEIGTSIESSWVVMLRWDGGDNVRVVENVEDCLLSYLSFSASSHSISFLQVISLMNYITHKRRILSYFVGVRGALQKAQQCQCKYT